MTKVCMMPVKVQVNDATFADIGILRHWFGTGSPGETIGHITRFVMDELGLERDNDVTDTSGPSGDDVLTFETAPNLAHTKPVAAWIDGKPIRNPKWIYVMVGMIAAVKNSTGLEGEQLVRALEVGARAFRYEEKGYRYFPEIGISIQSFAATAAWKEIARLADKHRIPVQVRFVWRNKPNARYPGRTGMLTAGSAQGRDKEIVPAFP